MCSQAATGFPLMGAVGYDGSHYYASWATTYMITSVQSPPAVRPIP